MSTTKLTKAELRSKFLLTVRAIQNIFHRAEHLTDIPPAAMACRLLATSFGANAERLLEDVSLSVEVLCDPIEGNSEVKALMLEYAARLNGKTTQPGAALVSLLSNRGVADEAIIEYLEQTGAVLLAAAQDLIQKAEAKLAEADELVNSAGSGEACGIDGCDVPSKPANGCGADRCCIVDERRCPHGHSSCEPGANGLCACGFPCP